MCYQCESAKNEKGQSLVEPVMTGVASLGKYKEITQPPDNRPIGQNNISKRQQELKDQGQRALTDKDKYAYRSVSHHAYRMIDRSSRYKDLQDRKTQKGGDKHVDITKCCCCGYARDEWVSVRKTSSYEAVIFGNTWTCGNVWLCPVCQSVILARRSDEIAKFGEWAVEQGKHVVMLTFTASHSSRGTLEEFAAKFQDGYGKFWNRSYMKRLQEVLGMKVEDLSEAPRIKVIEAKYSFENGWHWHAHVLIVIDKKADIIPYIPLLKNKWVECCAAVGLKATYDNGLDVLVGKNAKQANAFARYMAKEMTSGAIKVSRANDGITRYSIFSLAAECAVKEVDAPSEVQKYRDAIADYAYWTHGKKLAVWSGGLKDAVGLKEITDEGILEEKEDAANTVCGLLAVAWKYVARHAVHNAIKRIVLDGGDAAKIEEWLTEKGCPAGCVISGEDADLLYAFLNDAYTPEQLEDADCRARAEAVYHRVADYNAEHESRDYRDDDARLAANKWGSPTKLVNTYKDEKDMSFDELITIYGVQRQYYQWQHDEQRKARGVNGLCVLEVS